MQLPHHCNGHQQDGEISQDPWNRRYLRDQLLVAAVTVNLWVPVLVDRDTEEIICQDCTDVPESHDASHDFNGQTERLCDKYAMVEHK